MLFLGNPRHAKWTLQAAENVQTSLHHVLTYLDCIVTCDESNNQVTALRLDLPELFTVCKDHIHVLVEPWLLLAHNRRGMILTWQTLGLLCTGERELKAEICQNNVVPS